MLIEIDVLAVIWQGMEMRSMNKYLNEPIETESKFEVLRPYSEEIAEFISEKAKLGGFVLGNLKSVHNRDIYFDNENLDIFKRRGSLRTRIVGNEKLLVTLKLRVKSNDENPEQHVRTEIEATPTIKNVRKIAKQLKKFGLINRTFSKLDLKRVGIEGVLSIWGFHKQVQAENERTYRKIYSQEGNELATLFIDNVKFSHLHKQSRFVEIEIESASESINVVPDILRELKSTFPDAIVPSASSKYERGLDLVGLQDENKIETKLKVVGDTDDLVRKMLWLGNVLIQRINLRLGWDGRLKITDHYYDTFEPEFEFFRQSCYFRLRHQSGTQTEFTFREYSEANTERVSKQAKGEANGEEILNVLKYINTLGIKNFKIPNDVYAADDIDHLLNLAGLKLTLKVEIDRRVFPVLDDNQRKVAFIKLDKVNYSSQKTRAEYAEIEISSGHHDYMPQVSYIALTLLNELAPYLAVTNQAKYFTGQTLINPEISIGRESDGSGQGQILSFRILQDLNIEDSVDEFIIPSYSKVKLLDVLKEKFNVDELKTLAFELDIDHENLPSEGKVERVRELIDYMDRTDQLPLLGAHILRQRQKVDLVDLIE